jgi:Holliday junction resolvasome RuvABC endonuclease subunit
MKILSIDASTKSTGFALFENGTLQKSGCIAELKYRNKSKDRYPARMAKCGEYMADCIADMVDEFSPDLIVIEEISVGGRQGVAQIKSLASLHGMILYRLMNHIGSVYFMPSSGKMKSHGVEVPGWRKILQLKKNGCWKASAIARVEKDFGITPENDDEADAILIGKAFLGIAAKLGGE